MTDKVLQAEVAGLDTVGKRLKWARERKGRMWTQAHLAQAAGVSTSTIGMIESAGRISKGSLPDLAVALGVHHRWLRENEGPVLMDAVDLLVAQHEPRDLRRERMTGQDFSDSDMPPIAPTRPAPLPERRAEVRETELRAVLQEADRPEWLAYLGGHLDVGLGLRFDYMSPRAVVDLKTLRPDRIYAELFKLAIARKLDGSRRRRYALMLWMPDGGKLPQRVTVEANVMGLEVYACRSTLDVLDFMEQLEEPEQDLDD